MEIEKWHELNQQGLTDGPKPKPIQVGEKFIKTDRLPSKGIFWTQGIKDMHQLKKIILIKDGEIFRKIMND